MNTPTMRELRRRPALLRRRSVRQALAVIPGNSSPEVSTMDNVLNSRPDSDSCSSAASPDELVIQRRGRRCKTIIWSPDLDACKRDSLLSLSSRDCTPVKTPPTSNMILRSTPRKRLSLIDTRKSEFTTPEKKNGALQSLISFEASQKYSNDNLLNGLRGLSHEQLVRLIMDLVSMQEDGSLCEDERLRNVLLKKMPIADIQPLIDKLGTLSQNIYASLVSSNLDDSAYSRAYIHLDIFQKTLFDQGKKLQDSQHWVSLMSYVLAAWKITKELPEWENQGLHNTTHKCFKNLSQFCIEAIRHGDFKTATLGNLSESFEIMIGDCEDIKVCLQLVKQAKHEI